MIISGKTVWHEGDRFAGLKLPRPFSCVLITQEEDVAGELSADGREILWSDGDCWLRLESADGPDDGVVAPPAPKLAASFANSTMALATEVWESQSPQRLTALDAGRALLARDGKRLADALADGVSAEAGVDPAELWRAMRWTPDSEGPSPPAPLLIAAILLEWPEGVQTCLSHGADVNVSFAGPLRCRDGSTERDPRGAPSLRVALTVLGSTQSALCNVLLKAGVDPKTLRIVRRRHRGEMELDTAMLLDRWEGGSRVR